jgi:hypothetical protein
MTVIKEEDEKVIVDLSKIDRSKTPGSKPNTLCKMQTSNVDIPSEFFDAGYKFESYCCIKMNIEGEGLFYMCSVDKPRCW